jgi:TIR domain
VAGTEVGIFSSSCPFPVAVLLRVLLAHRFQWLLDAALSLNILAMEGGGLFVTMPSTNVGAGYRYRFDVALSFAGTERSYAQALAAILTLNGVSVFFDELFEAEIWGQNLTEYLSDLYSQQAKYCVIIVSKQYCERVFTNVERRSALDRAITTRSEYILPIVTDEAWLTGVPRATAYLDFRQKSLLAIAELLVGKIRGPAAPVRLALPADLNLPRIPMGNLSAADLKKYLLDLVEGSRRIGVAVFGAIIHDERTAEYRKLLVAPDYWDALNRTSGPHFEIFALRDQVQSRVGLDRSFELLTLYSAGRSQSRTQFFSQLLSDYFGEPDTKLAYPSFLLFLMDRGNITHCRLIPLKRGSVEEVFLALQSLFASVAEVIVNWKREGGDRTDTLWSRLRRRLLDEKYTIYIQSAPSDGREAIERLSPHFT